MQIETISKLLKVAPRGRGAERNKVRNKNKKREEEEEDFATFCSAANNCCAIKISQRHTFSISLDRIKGPSFARHIARERESK